MKKSLAVMLALIMVLCMIPTTALAANGTGHQISVKIYKVVLDSSKPLGYQNPELVNTITVICQDATGHSGYNHSVKLKEFYPTNFGLPTTDWTGWQFDSYYTKGKDNNTFYNFTSSRVNATANVTGSEPYSCSKNFYLVYKEAAPQTQDITLTYNANGGSGAPEPQTQTVESGKEATFTVNSKEPTRTNYDFKGWSTAKNAAAAEYKGGDSITISQDTTLYAVWEENNEPQPETPPAKPDPRPSVTPTIDGLTGVDVVEVKCITENSGHETKRYTLLDGGYTVGDVESDATSGYTCTITVKPGKYESAYNETYSGHTLVDPSQPGKIKLEWDKYNQKWKLATPSGVPVVFDVECETTQPENPAELTSFVKSRVTAITDTMPNPPEGVTFNTAPKVTFDANNTTANLLYSFTVTGTPGAEVTITDMGAKFYNNGNWVENNITVTLPTPTEGAADYVTYTVYGYRQFTKNDIDDKVLKNTATAGVEGSEELVPGKATVPAEDKTGSGPSESPEPSPSTNPNPTPTPTPGGGNGGGGHWHPTTTPVPVIVIPPKTGDMTIWQSILHFLGIR